MTDESGKLQSTFCIRSYLIPLGTPLTTGRTLTKNETNLVFVLFLVRIKRSALNYKINNASKSRTSRYSAQGTFRSVYRETVDGESTHGELDVAVIKRQQRNEAIGALGRLRLWL